MARGHQPTHSCFGSAQTLEKPLRRSRVVGRTSAAEPSRAWVVVVVESSSDAAGYTNIHLGLSQGISGCYKPMPPGTLLGFATWLPAFVPWAVAG